MLVLALAILSSAPAYPVGSVPASPSVAVAEPVPDDAELVTLEATIGEIRIRNENIFDTEDPRENNWLFRLANRLHIRTRPYVISRQLLFHTGDRYNPRLLSESERILRSNPYFYDAWIRPVAFHDGRVDIEVRTRDVWTLQPGVSFGRKGGKNTSSVDLTEKNLLGLGSAMSISRTSAAERTTDALEYSDTHVAGTRLHTDLLLADTSDGSVQRYFLERPFFALDTRWSAGILFSEEERIDTLVGVETVASEYRVMAKSFRLSGGWSRGLHHGWALRVLLGVTRDETRFSDPPGGTGGAPVPADRVLVYPYGGMELVEDRFEEARNRDRSTGPKTSSSERASGRPWAFPHPDSAQTGNPGRFPPRSDRGGISANAGPSFSAGRRTGGCRTGRHGTRTWTGSFGSIAPSPGNGCSSPPRKVPA